MIQVSKSAPAGRVAFLSSGARKGKLVRGGSSHDLFSVDTEYHSIDRASFMEKVLGKVFFFRKGFL